MAASNTLAKKLVRLSIFMSAAVTLAAPVENANIPSPQPFKIDLSSGVPRMIRKIKDTILPDQPEYPNLGSTAGVSLGFLKQLQREWVTDFDWSKEEASMNKYNHFTTNIEGLKIHFIHQKSSEPDAIPLLMLHGWPGSFLEFLPVVDQITKKGVTSKGKPVSFHTIVPSLPGFGFSSAPPANWTADDTARVFNTLMTEVLGYKKFATHASDWGVAIAYTLYDNYNQSTRASHFTFIPFYPLTPTELAARNITLMSALEQREEQRFLDWSTNGNGYFIEQSTEPNTIGLALQDDPVGQLSWMGYKFAIWSDPRAGTPPSVLNHNEILRSISLYYLSRSFLSSVFMYYQNPNGFRTTYSKAKTDAPMLFSAFEYNAAFWPPALVATVGNLVAYKNHDFGGHFAGLDNPPALIEDLREIGNYWA